MHFEIFFIMKIALIGYGKMGRMIEKIALARGHKIVCKIDVDNQQDFDSEAFASADVAIEFTNPTAAYDNYLKAWSRGVKVEELQCSNCKEFGGWIQMRRPDRTCERPWCSKWNEFCQPQKHECKKEGGAK